MNEYLKIKTSKGYLYYSEFRSASLKTRPTTDGRFVINIDITTFQGLPTQKTTQKEDEKIVSTLLDSSGSVLFKLENGIIPNLDIDNHKLWIEDGGSEDTGGLERMLAAKEGYCTKQDAQKRDSFISMIIDKYPKFEQKYQLNW